MGTLLVRKAKGGRSAKKDPALVRSTTVSVRVSASEYTELREKAKTMGFTPAQWLREAGLARPLPLPPVPAVNREEYAELARLAADVSELTRQANEGKQTAVTSAFLEQLTTEVKQLRFALLGIDSPPESHSEDS
jgi:translation initiation factor IF-2